MKQTILSVISTLTALSICLSLPVMLHAQEQVDSYNKELLKQEYRFFGLESEMGFEEEVPETVILENEEAQIAIPRSEPVPQPKSKPQPNWHENDLDIEEMYAGGIISDAEEPLYETQELPDETPADVVMSTETLSEEAQNDRFFLFGNITALASYSALIKNSSTTGGDLNGYLAPTYKLNDKTFLIFLMNGLYNKSKQVYVQDTGPRISTETRSISFTPTVKYGISDTLSISPSFIFTKSQSRQDTSIRWGKDLYDYTEVGGSLLLEKILENTDTMKRDVSVTLQAYKRAYPNYNSLISIAGLGTIEEKEKDYNGFLAMASYREQKSEGLSYQVSGNVLYKQFTDKLIENSWGGRDNKKQRDIMLTLESSLNYKVAKNLSLLLDSSFIYNFSNQNLATGFFPAIEFTKDYHSYYNVIVTPGMEFTYTLPNGRDLTVREQFAFNFTRYLGRNAKNIYGQITGREEDFTQEVSIVATYNYSKRLDLILSGNVRNVRSSMKEESTFRYNYGLYNIGIGFSYRL